MSSEKKMLLVMVAAVIGLFLMVSLIITEIDKAGGVKGIAVSIGKDIKEISAEIDKHQVIETSND